jgi:hypothetical protein
VNVLAFVSTVVSQPSGIALLAGLTYFAVIVVTIVLTAKFAPRRRAPR